MACVGVMIISYYLLYIINIKYKHNINRKISKYLTLQYYYYYLLSIIITKIMTQDEEFLKHLVKYIGKILVAPHMTSGNVIFK